TWKGVYVVGADLLGGVPFECLRVKGRELGTTAALAYLPSIPVGLALSRMQAGSAKGLGVLLLAAPTIPKGSPGTIPFSSEDKAALTAGFARSTVLTGASA